MNECKQLRIDVEAAKSLIGWKALFADAVCEGAKQLALESTHPDHVTVSHYRQAAGIALQTLSDKILAEERCDGQQEAA
jgi:hypothetical protein